MKSIIPFVLAFVASLALHAQEQRLTITPLAKNFYIYTTYRPVNGQPFPSNSMYVVTDSGVVMIDTPWDVDQTVPLLDSIEARHHMPVVLCIVTHYHDDRTGGLDILRERGIRTYSTVRTLELCRAKSEKEAEFQFSRDTTFRVGSLTFTTFYPGEGHTRDNIVIWFPKERVLYGGCLVKSMEATGLGNVVDANVEQWPVTIRKVMKRFRNPRFIIPGHRSWRGRSALKHTLQLLKENRKRSR
jgi:glyoxylase-like metal-dependent hydrolase (beta-lactamase superfamily II)